MSDVSGQRKRASGEGDEIDQINVMAMEKRRRDLMGKPVKIGPVFNRPLMTEISRLRAAIQRARNILHAHNRPNEPLPNEARIRARDILDLALEPVPHKAEEEG